MYKDYGIFKDFTKTVYEADKKKRIIITFKLEQSKVFRRFLLDPILNIPKKVWFELEELVKQYEHLDVSMEWLTSLAISCLLTSMMIIISIILMS